MLIKASKVIGLPVFTISDGKKIENVDDVIYDPIKNKIEALLIEKGGWFAESRVILFSDLEGIGYDAALITSPARIKKLTEVSKNIEAIVKNDTYLTNTKIITEDGIELGRVSDIYFNATTGRVEEFEVSQGTLRSWKEGKKRIKIESLVTIGHDATIVRIYSPEKTMGIGEAHVQDVQEVNKPTEADMIQAQTDKLVEEVRSKTEEVKPVTTSPIANEEMAQRQEPVREAMTQTQDPVHEQQTVQNAETVPAETEKVEEHVQAAEKTPEQASIDMKSRLLERKKRDAVGLYLTKNILTPTDTILAKEGEMVTYRLLQEAEDVGILDQIFNNVAPHIMPMAV